MAWPEPLLSGSPRNFNLASLWHEREKMRSDPGRFAFHRPGQRWILGYALPPFQRPLVWDEERMIRFCESAVLRLHLGTFVYNNTQDEPLERTSEGEFFHYTDRWLIDGQQRLTALDRFFDDAFPVFGLRWSQIPERERRRFLNGTPFEAFEIQIADEAVLRELYDRLNFGGVPHTPEQRATAKSGATVAEAEADDDWEPIQPVSIPEPKTGWRSLGTFDEHEKAKLRPIAETLAMLDGNAFFRLPGFEGEQWYENYLPQAAALYERLGGDRILAETTSFYRYAENARPDAPRSHADGDAGPVPGASRR